MRLSNHLFSLVLCLILAASAFAADQQSLPATLYVVHGIPSRVAEAVAENNVAGMPIDVIANGDCLVQGLTYTNITGPLTLAPGQYNLQISNANALSPCTNPALIESQVTLATGANVSLVAALSGGQPILQQLTIEAAPLPAGSARFIFANSADAPTLQVTLTDVRATTPKTFTLTAAPATQSETNIPAGTYLMQIVASGSTAVLTSQQIALGDQYDTYTYAAGQEARNSMVLINRVVKHGF